MCTEVLIKTDIEFKNADEVLNHIADELIAKGLVTDSYRHAIFEREHQYPTGIALDQHAVAIPHCDAKHSLKPAIYFIRPNKTVVFNRADEDTTIAVEMIIALVVTDPQAQLKLLRTLFGKLQDNQFVTELLHFSNEQLRSLINQYLNFN